MIKKVIIAVLVVLIIASGGAGIFYIKNKSNIDAYFLSRKYTTAQLKEKMDASSKSFDKVLKENIDNLPRKITDEEQLEIDTGKATLYDVVSKMYEEQRNEEKKQQQEKEQQIAEQQEKQQQAEKQQNDENVEQTISNYIGKMYALEASFQGQLSGTIDQGKAEYRQLILEKNKNARSIIASKYAGKITALEGSCDAQVNSVISELKSYLTAHGRSTDTADALYNAYIDKKLSVKAYYLSKL